MTWTTNTDRVGGEFVLYSTLSSQQNIEMNDVIIENCDDELQSSLQLVSLLPTLSKCLYYDVSWGSWWPHGTSPDHRPVVGQEDTKSWLLEPVLILRPRTQTLTTQHTNTPQNQNQIENIQKWKK